MTDEGREGGVLIPFPRKLFFSNPSSNPTIPACVTQIEIPFPFFYCFFHESQSQCTKSHFPASKKGKSQLPFYPFTTLTDYCYLFSSAEGYFSSGKQFEKICIVLNEKINFIWSIFVGVWINVVTLLLWIKSDKKYHTWKKETQINNAGKEF